MDVMNVVGKRDQRETERERDGEGARGQREKARDLRVQMMRGKDGDCCCCCCDERCVTSRGGEQAPRRMLATNAQC